MSRRFLEAGPSVLLQAFMDFQWVQWIFGYLKDKIDLNSALCSANNQYVIIESEVLLDFARS